MLTRTFSHIPGIGPATEKKLRDSNIHTWTDIDRLSQSPLSTAKQDEIREWTARSIQSLESNDPLFFESRLPSGQHFRLFPEFRPSCVYLDIETTGLDASAVITTIAMYDGKDIFYYVQGKNLADFPDRIKDYSILITYNGRCFDIPFIESYFNISLPHAQIDLRYVLGNLGFKGGLKKCEKSLGLDRGDLDGVDGFFAVLLWREYRRNNSQKALETLLAYNIEDVINLEELMIKAYNMNVDRLELDPSHRIPLPKKPQNPFRGDEATIRTIKKRGMIY